MSEEQLSYRDRLNLIRNGMAERTTKAKEKKSIPRVSAKRAAEMKAEKEKGKPVGKLEMDKWFFDIMMKHVTSFSSGAGCLCMECSSFIPLEFFRHATAHLLPKKLFRSIATHPDNYLILGAGCGCHEKSHRLDKFVQMKCWPEAARRIKILLPLLPIDELRHVSSQLLIALDNTP